LFYRFFLASILAIPILIYFWPQMRKLKKHLPIIIGLELLGTTATLSFLYEGLQRTSALEASFLATTSPIFITLAAIFYLKEHESRHEALGLALAFLGTALLALEPVISGRGNSTVGFSALG